MAEPVFFLHEAKLVRPPFRPTWCVSCMTSRKRKPSTRYPVLACFISLLSLILSHTPVFTLGHTVLCLFPLRSGQNGSRSWTARQKKAASKNCTRTHLIFMFCLSSCSQHYRSRCLNTTTTTKNESPGGGARSDSTPPLTLPLYALNCLFGLT